MVNREKSSMGSNFNMDTINLSIIIPIYNEEGNIEELSEKIISSLGKEDITYEMIFIDDGSTDNSLSVLERIASANSNFKVIRFKRNFGKAAAYSAGFRHARGEIILTMDGDLQDDPGEIIKFVRKMDEGYDLVTGWKYKGKGSFSKRIPSRIFNLVTSFITGVKIHDFNCPFKAYKRDVVKNLHIYGELYRFIPVLANWRGHKIAEIQVENYPRKSGKSKYGFARLIKGALDLLTVILVTKFFNRPLHLFGISGIVMSSLGFIMSLFFTILWFMGQRPIQNRPLLLSGLFLLFLGLQFICIGLVGELIINSKLTSEDQYTIEKIIN
jgi:glycosyltransferase involved in cell wall biosynthesis